MNITYLFGAGASYNAIPIVGELEKAFERISSLSEGQLNTALQHNDATSRELKANFTLFKALLKDCAYNAKVFGTIDTYAKKLSISKSDIDLNKTKAALSLFFTIWQEFQLKEHDLSGVRKITEHTLNKKGFQDIDSRYFGLLTNYLENTGDKIKFQDEIKFLSWNYDTQLERSLAIITDSDVDKVFNNYNIYPFVKESHQGLPDIVHLNGIAGLYESENKTVHLFREKNPEGGINLESLLRNNLYFIGSTEKQTANPGNHFSFAWENNEIAKKSREHAKKILSNTEILVVIGYSFPTFNNQIDKELFETLKTNGKFKKIYYQDPQASVELLNARFGINESQIKVVKEINQFILPLDSHALKADEWHFHFPEKSSSNKLWT